MAEQIKQFHSSTRNTVGAPVAVISNNGTTKALVKEITISNPSYITNNFDILIDGIVKYSNISIAPDETVKFSNENFVVPENKSMSIRINNDTSIMKSSVLAPEYSGITLGAGTINQPAVIENDNYVYVAGATTAGIWYAIFDKTTRQMIHNNSFSDVLLSVDVDKISLTETNTHILIQYSDNSTVTANAVAVNKDDFSQETMDNITVPSISNSTHCSMTLLDPVTRDKSSWAFYINSSDILGIFTPKNEFDADLAIDNIITTGAISEMMCVALSDGNGVIIGQSSIGETHLQLVDSTGAETGTQVDITSTTDLFGATALSNGTFALLTTGGLTIYNNDLSLNTAIVSLASILPGALIPLPLNASTRGSTSGQMQSDKNDLLYICVNYAGSPSQFTLIIDASGALIGQLTGDAHIFQSATSQVNSNGLVYLADEGFLISGAIDATETTLYYKKPGGYLNYDVSGVEVTA